MTEPEGLSTLKVILGSGFTDLDQERSQEGEGSVLDAQSSRLDKKYPKENTELKFSLENVWLLPWLR